MQRKCLDTTEVVGDPCSTEKEFWYNGAKAIKIKQKAKTIPDYVGLAPEIGYSPSAMSPLFDYELVQKKLVPENPEQEKIGGSFPAYYSRSEAGELLLREAADDKATAIVCIGHIAEKDNPNILKYEKGKMTIARTRGNVSYNAYPIGLGNLNGHEVAVDYAIGHVLVDNKLYSTVSLEETSIPGLFAPSQVALWTWKLLRSL